MRRRLSARHVWVLMHRWVGLAMAGFLVAVGLTGSILAFNSELEHVFAPNLYAMSRAGIKPLDLAALSEKAKRQLPGVNVTGVMWTDERQVSVMYDGERKQPGSWLEESRYTEIFLDPWSGDILGRRTRGDLSEGIINLMPFIYDLHWRLVLGAFGQWTLGIVALLWSVDCFVALYLTLPKGRSEFWRRWKPSWLIKRGAHIIRLNFDLHRASGLWLWPMLFIFAWSSVMMNIRPVYEPVMRTLFDYQSDPLFTGVHTSNPNPVLNWAAAESRGQQLIARLSAERGFTAGQALSLMYLQSAGVYLYEVRGSRDLFERAPKGGGTYVAFDGDTGDFRELVQSTGEHLGNTIESWLYALHMARVFGLPYQVFVCLLGLSVALLSSTGFYIWIFKRRARRRSLTHRRTAASSL